MQFLLYNDKIVYTLNMYIKSQNQQHNQQE